MEEQNNMEEPLESSYSIRILREKSMRLLSAMLNPPKVIHTSEGLPRNWKGLAELCDIETYLISNLEFHTDPTKEALRLWREKGNEATIRQLMKNLERLDRLDVVDDISTSIAEDIKFHKQHPNGYKSQPTALYPDHDKRVLTTDDVMNLEKNVPLIKYDAFILFAEDDIQFATKVIERMEKQYNLKFCAKERDLVGGTFEHEAIIKLISERCEKLIVILSPSFFSSPMNKFFLNFTQAISLEQRKIIPCLYKPCPNMPPEVRCYFMLDYTKPRVLWNFWDKLYESIKTQRAPSDTTIRMDETPRQLIIKTNSHRDNQLRPRPPHHTVKFSSLVDLTKSDPDQILLDPNLNPSTSANSLGNTTYAEPAGRERKVKTKLGWWRKILQKYNKNYQKRNQHI